MNYVEKNFVKTSDWETPVASVRRQRITVVRKTVLAGLFILCGMMGCAEKNFDVPMKKPAEINMNRYRRVAVWGVTGDDGQTLADELTVALFNSNYFEVKNQQEFQKILQAQANQQMTSGTIDPALLAETGKLLPEAAMITGRISNRKYAETVKRQDGVQVSSDGSKRPIFTYTRVGTANLNVILSVTDLTSGKLLATKNLAVTKVQQSDGYKFTQPLADYQINASVPPMDPSEAYAAARADAIAQFMKAIAPYEVNVTVTLFSGDGTFQFSDEPLLGTGISQAKSGQWIEAAAIFKNAAETYENNPETAKDLVARAWYNHGMALVMVGNYDEGIVAIAKAQKLNPEPAFAGAILRAKQFKKDAEKLKEQLGPGASNSLIRLRIALAHLIVES